MLVGQNCFETSITTPLKLRFKTKNPPEQQTAHIRKTVIVGGFCLMIPQSLEDSGSYSLLFKVGNTGL